MLSDDLAILHLQYSTQWDGLAHAGSMFDANGDGLPEALYYNGYAAGATWSDRATSAMQACPSRRGAPPAPRPRMRLALRAWHAPACKAAV